MYVTILIKYGFGNIHCWPETSQATSCGVREGSCLGVDANKKTTWSQSEGISCEPFQSHPCIFAATTKSRTNWPGASIPTFRDPTSTTTSSTPISLHLSMATVKPLPCALCRRARLRWQIQAQFRACCMGRKHCKDRVVCIWFIDLDVRWFETSKETPVDHLNDERELRVNQHHFGHCRLACSRSCKVLYPAI